jgi:hypothetical protein
LVIVTLNQNPPVLSAFKSSGKVGEDEKKGFDGKGEKNKYVGEVGFMLQYAVMTFKFFSFVSS